MRFKQVFAALNTPTALILCLLSSCLLSAQAAATEPPFLARKPVRDYLIDISEEHRLNRILLANLFAEIRSQQSVLDAVSRPAEKVLTWAQYQPIFIKKQRIDAGREFMRQHAATLSRAEQTYGVPANIIAAIIGVETFYGKVTGQYGVLESLATLAFDYPPRAGFFKSELTEYLILSQAEGWDTLAIKGSYAGAMGWPQFISSSYRHYAVDFDDDGKRDLVNSVPDAIGSVANYLNLHGWKTDQPVAKLLSVPAKSRAAVKALQRKSLKPEILPKKLTDMGFVVSGKKPVSVLNLQGKGGEEAWVGYTNLYVITRYNHSELYALAVFQLSELLTN